MNALGIVGWPESGRRRPGEVWRALGRMWRGGRSMNVRNEPQPGPHSPRRGPASLPLPPCPGRHHGGPPPRARTPAASSVPARRRRPAATTRPGLSGQRPPSRGTAPVQGVPATRVRQVHDAKVCPGRGQRRGRAHQKQIDDVESLALRIADAVAVRRIGTPFDVQEGCPTSRAMARAL